MLFFAGTSVIKVAASDPDGPDAELSYFIYSGAKDNFVLNQKSGLISVATGADLDRDQYGAEYKIIVRFASSIEFYWILLIVYHKIFITCILHKSFVHMSI